MKAQEDEIVRTEAIAKEYGLSEPLAREIVTEGTMRALRRSKLGWLVLIGGVGLAGWLYTGTGAGPDSAVWILIFTVAAWLSIGRCLAGPAIRKAAAEKAARIEGLRREPSRQSVPRQGSGRL